NTMVAAYAQNGYIQKARSMFALLPRANVDTYNSMINGFAKAGYGNDAIILFYEMILIGVFPDSFTFSSVLAACSHGGLLKNGTKLFVLLSGEHQVTPHVEHYSSMVDIYGRVGLVTEAQELIDTMPFFPQPETLRALLNACRI
ncbi:hypothetical protein SELMODRAFT_16621, partial [Selaginella moellendorffii]